MEDGMYHSSNRVEQCLFEEQSASNAGLSKQDVLPVHREMPQPSCQPAQFTALQCYNSVFFSAIATSPEKTRSVFPGPFPGLLYRQRVRRSKQQPRWT